MNYEQQKEILELRLKLINDNAQKHYERAQNYSNFIIVAGYAAFFAVFTNLSPDISTETRIISGIAMGISCTIFILWELFKMIYTGYYIRKLLITCAQSQSEKQYNQNIDNLDKFEKKFNSQTGRLWFFILLMTIIPGLYAISIFVFESINVILK